MIADKYLLLSTYNLLLLKNCLVIHSVTVVRISEIVE